MDKIPGGNLKGLQNPDFQDAIKNSEKNINEIKEQLDVFLNDLSGFIQYLESQEDYLATMQEMKETTENSDEYAITGFKHEDILKVKENIEKCKIVIDAIKNEINELGLQKFSFADNIEEFKNLENRFRDVLIRVNPEESQ